MSPHDEAILSDLDAEQRSIRAEDISHKPYLTIKEAARLLDVSEPTIRRWIKGGDLPAFKVKRTYRILRSDLDRMTGA